ncbi:MAG: DUF3431 domain-containing protein [Deltaproteobacteria bacterium]|nr:DUF3431 domain-containing protein [Deltaproteobacteria bacterium]
MTATPLRRRRDPPGPPPAVAVDLVVARFAESVDWVRNVPSPVRIFVYDKGGDLHPERLPWARVEPLPNVGREAHTYLHHVIARLDAGDLAPVTFFCQGHPFDHASDLHAAVRAVVAGRERVDRFRWLGFIVDTDDPRGRRLFVRWSRNEDGRELALDRFHEALFGVPCPPSVPFFPGGQFAATAEAIRARPRAFWERAFSLAATFPDGAHCFERLWDRVLGVEGVDPSLLDASGCRYFKRIRRIDAANEPG